MNKICLFVLTIVLLTSSSVFVAAQDEDETYVPPPKYALSYVFDEYNANDVSTDAEKEKIEVYVLQISNISRYAGGYIYVYQGARDYKFDYDKRINSINKIIDVNLATASMDAYRVYARFGGFRESSTIEMIIEPPQAEHKSFTPSISLLDVKSLDDTSLPKDTTQKTGQELLDKLIKKIKPPYPAAAKAVRAIGEVGVLTKIDEKGIVTEAKAFIGHPLLRQACEQAVRYWQFKPEKQKGVAVKIVGIAVCDFNPDDY